MTWLEEFLEITKSMIHQRKMEKLDLIRINLPLPKALTRK